MSNQPGAQGAPKPHCPPAQPGGSVVSGTRRPVDMCEMAVRPRRPVESVEFDPSDAGAVVARMDELAAAGDGWINLLPGVPEEEADEPPRGVFSALFGAPQAPVSMGTWMPAGGRRPEETLGFMHPRGRGAAEQLATAGVGVPAGWQIRQDHPRRGLILRPSPGTSHAELLRWALQAGAQLSVVPLTGRWQARVYLPRPRSTTS